MNEPINSWREEAALFGRREMVSQAVLAECYAALYLASAEPHALSARRKVDKKSMLERWVTFLGRNRHVSTLTKSDVTKYELQRRKNVKQYTVYNE